MAISAKYRRLAAPLGAAAVVLVAAACSSSSTSSSTTPAGGATTGSFTTPATSTSSSSAPTTGSSTSAATGTPYVIGNIGTFSGPYASSDIGAHDAMDAWVKYTNAHGGVNGHPIKLIQDDDQLNAGLALTDVKAMVQQDHVMAIVGTASVGAEDAWAPYIATTTTPVIGDDLAGDEMGKYKNFYPEGTARATGYYFAPPKIANQLGDKQYGAVFCAEAAACSQIATSQKAQASAAGVSFVYSGSASATATSYTAQCLAAKSSGAKAVVLLLAGSVAGQFAAACAQQGFTPQWLQAANGFTEQEKSISSLNGSAGPLPDFPWFSSATPAMQAFQDAMKSYEPQDFSSTSYGYTESAAMAWASAQIFAAAAAKLPAGQDSSADVITQLGQLPKGDTFGGLTPPITYSAASGPQPDDKCFFEIQLKSGTYGALNGAKAVCP
jgi:branched-chain amino acid transport system substrate-binding protein